MSTPRFLSSEIPAGATRVELTGDEAHHLRHVLRLGVGAAVRVFDGRGGEWAGRVAALARDRVTVRLEHAVTPVAEPKVSVTLAMGLLSGDQMDTVVRDATMLGVARVIPVSTAQVVVPKGARGAAAVDRWRRVAIASAKQCRRAIVPEIAPVTPLSDVFAGRTAPVVMCVEPTFAGAKDVAAVGARTPSVTLVIGPEGGW